MKKLRILATTDIHGTILSHSYLNNKETNSSLSRISTAIKHYRNDELILIDNGDVLQGSPLVAYNNRYQHFSLFAKAMNALNYNYYTLGNHDFNYGIDVLARFISENNAEGLTQNILIHNQPIGSSRIYTSEEGHTIAFIGAVTDYLPNWEQPKNLENITIFDVKDTIQKQVELLRHEVDTVVVCYHGGFERDLETGELQEHTKENVGYELTTIPGIDVLITGHQHRSLVTSINDVLCVQCTFNAQEFMILELDKKGWSARLEQVSNYEIDHTFEALFQKDEALVQEWLDTEIGHGPDMIIDDVFKAQLTKPMFTSFVNQVAIDYFKADFAFSSLFNQSPGLKQHITMRDLIASYPYPNTFVLIEITKELLLEYLEKNATYFELHGDLVTITPEFVSPKLEMYNYDMGDGLSYQIDLTKPKGQRITLLEISDKETYTMVINNYRASGGGKFFMIKDARKIKEDPNEVIDLLYDYIYNNSPLQVNHSNNIILKTK